MTTLRLDHRPDQWHHRRPWLDPAVGDTTMCQLNRGATGAAAALALIRPKRIIRLAITPHPGWTPEQQAKIDKYVSQLDLFGSEDRTLLQALH